LAGVAVTSYNQSAIKSYKAHGTVVLCVGKYLLTLAPRLVA